LEFGQNAAGEKLRLGDVTSTNITLLKGGVQMNVVPTEASAGIDMRISPFVDYDELEKRITSWCSSEEVELLFVQKTIKTPPTHLDESNQEWQVLKKVAASR
jgi:aminoacylase